MTKIIAFSGRKQSGKSTAGEYVQSLMYSINPQIDVNTYSFADPLKKNICIDILGLTPQQCWGSDEDKNSLTSLRWEDMPGILTPELAKYFYGKYDEAFTIEDFHSFGFTIHEPGLMTAREVMEYVGTKMFRKMKDKVWVEATLKEIEKDKPDIALLLDNRFPNEVDPILDAGGYVIRLTRNPFNSSAEPESALDPDKYDWNKFSCIVHNQEMTEEEKNHQIHSFLNNKGLLPL